jgi:hypothetical protein
MNRKKGKQRLHGVYLEIAEGFSMTKPVILNIPRIRVAVPISS